MHFVVCLDFYSITSQIFLKSIFLTEARAVSSASRTFEKPVTATTRVHEQGAQS